MQLHQDDKGRQCHQVTLPQTFFLSWPEYEIKMLGCCQIGSSQLNFSFALLTFTVTLLHAPSFSLAKHSFIL